MEICQICKGKNIQYVAWVDINTNKVKDTYSAHPEIWCEDCQEFVKTETA